MTSSHDHRWTPGLPDLDATGADEPDPASPTGAAGTHARRHIDHVALVSGLTFSAIAASVLVNEAGVASIEGRWGWPVLLIGLGIAGLVSGGRSR